MGKHVAKQDQFTFDGETWERANWDSREEYPDHLFVYQDTIVAGDLRITHDRSYLVDIGGRLEIKLPLPGKWTMYRKVQ